MVGTTIRVTIPPVVKTVCEGNKILRPLFVSSLFFTFCFGKFGFLSESFHTFYTLNTDTE